MDDDAFRALADEKRLELENRLRNLIWTVSGDYSLNESPDVDSFQVSKYIALYDAIWKGALAKHFDRNALSLYVAKKLFLGAQEPLLLDCVAICGEAAGFPKAEEERAGANAIRQKALDDIIEHSFARLNETAQGKLRLAAIRCYISGENTGEARLREPCETILKLKNAESIDDLVRAIDKIYNGIDATFARLHGSLEDVLSVSMDELRASSLWSDIFDDEIYQNFDQALDTISSTIMNLTSLTEDEKITKKAVQSRIIINEESLAKVARYIEINFGKPYLSQSESKKIAAALCRGVHAGSSLHFTDGILHSDGPDNYQRKYSQRQYEKNMMVFYDNYRIVRKNITILTSIIRNEMRIHDEADVRSSNFGTLALEKLWRVGRTKNNKLFRQTVTRSSWQFVVDILIDGSGSQSKRQSKVALQSYIISEALSNLSIPHRVVSFCSFWNYTVLRRYRDYDDSRELNGRVLEFSASSNNRDGLAMRAALYSLTEREEENKIVIVLSDGRPNDVSINNPNAPTQELYTGEAAISDTAREVRRARGLGVCVLGVFAGKEEDLAAEKRIFGSDFAYIRDINNFSKLVGLYLRKQIENSQ
ncbi:MAG: VWA domain-containing protein [Eubacteriaceae bacterium]|nr:VWA domain-containing protein [Eubacteriaceae bacterium]